MIERVSMPVKKCFIILCGLLVTASFLNCGGQKIKNNKRILDNYSDDLSYNFQKVFYFMPMPLHHQWRSAYLSLNHQTEDNETLLKALSPDNIRSNIHEVYCIFLKSEKIPFILQFPNRKIFDRYVVRLEENPNITQEVLKELLQFEYAAALIDDGIELVTDNFVYIQEDALINGKPRYWLSEDYYAYFQSDDFIRDINALSAKLSGKK